MIKGFKMNKKEKAIKIIRECDLYGLSPIKRGIYLESSQFMLEQAETWSDDAPGKSIDFSAYPYWITAVSGTLPIGITGVDNSDLFNAIE
jgi:hypothetical protein